MRQLVICFYLFCACTTFTLHAQSFSTRKLAELGGCISKTSLPKKDSIFKCAQVKGQLVRIEYNYKKEVTHLGIAVFSQGTKEKYGTPVCNFIERLMLELALQGNNPNEINKKLKEYKISMEDRTGWRSSSILLPDITVGAILNRMKGTAQFSLKQWGNYYAASWALGNNKFFVSIPASRELIFGTNKKESDEILNKLIQENRCHTYYRDNEENESYDNLVDTVVDNQNVFVKKGSSFVLTKINSDIYMSKDVVERYYPLNDRNYPSFSLKNLLLTPNLNPTIQLHLKHSMYGNRNSECDIRWTDFVCFFKQGFDMYCYVEDSKSPTLKATVILHSTKYNYIHLLSITADADTIFQKDGQLYAELYSNIPQNNIKSLFQTNL